jgi:hypothetical protein
MEHLQWMINRFDEIQTEESRCEMQDVYTVDQH